MSNRVSKAAELAANGAIILVAVLLGVVLVKNYLLPGGGSAAPPPAPLAAGTKLSLDGVDWAQNKQTLLMVVSETCHYCTESADFYKRLAAERAARGDLRIVAVLPQEVAAGRAYLEKLGVAVDDVKKAPPGGLGVRGTPTLILADGAGSVTDSWSGKLPPDAEEAVLGRLRARR
jgi:hypothetical protein